MPLAVVISTETGHHHLVVAGNQLCFPISPPFMTEPARLLERVLFLMHPYCFL